jgi:hypothetical protein
MGNLWGDRVAHPDLKQLTAFGHGRLTDAEDRVIADHLAGCKTCQAFLDTLPDDALLALIRPLFTSGRRSASNRRTSLPNPLDTRALLNDRVSCSPPD